MSPAESPRQNWELCFTAQWQKEEIHSSANAIALLIFIIQQSENYNAFLQERQNWLHLQKHFPRFLAKVKVIMKGHFIFWWTHFKAGLCERLSAALQMFVYWTAAPTGSWTSSCATLCCSQTSALRLHAPSSWLKTAEPAPNAVTVPGAVCCC